MLPDQSTVLHCVMNGITDYRCIRDRAWGGVNKCSMERPGFDIPSRVIINIAIKIKRLFADSRGCGQ